MGITHNGVEIQNVTFDSSDTQKVVFDGVTVFEKGGEVPEIPTDCIMFYGKNGGDFLLSVGGTKERDGFVEYSADRETWQEWDGSELNSSGGTFTDTPEINTTYYGAW